MACCGDKRRSDALRAYVGTEERKNGVNRLILRGYQVFRRDFLYLCEGKDDGPVGMMMSCHGAWRGGGVCLKRRKRAGILCARFTLLYTAQVLGPNCKMG